MQQKSNEPPNINHRVVNVIVFPITKRASVTSKKQIEGNSTRVACRSLKTIANFVTLQNQNTMGEFDNCFGFSFLVFSAQRRGEVQSMRKLQVDTPKRLSFPIEGHV